VSQSIIFEDVEVGRHCRIRRAIIDKGAEIPEGTTIGYDLEEDRRKYFVSDEGIVVVPKKGALSTRPPE
jgi:glucose-1-phosphate adenylyltransferase